VTTVSGSSAAKHHSHEEREPISAEATANAEVVVTDAEERDRFEAHVDGVLAGVLTYQRTDGLVVYPHTKVLPAYEGRGIGGELTRAALDDARRRDLKVDPACPFIEAWIDRNPGYADLVA
jgi:uncharacterized protein